MRVEMMRNILLMKRNMLPLINLAAAETANILNAQVKKTYKNAHLQLNPENVRLTLQRIRAVSRPRMSKAVTDCKIKDR